jgi:hypothetical protein
MGFNVEIFYDVVGDCLRRGVDPGAMKNLTSQ